LASEQRDSLEQLARGFREISLGSGLEIFTCCEAVDLAAMGIEHGACIDSDLIQRLFAVAVPARKDRHQRADCACVESVDMGSYNSCCFGCAYCYANFNSLMLERNSRSHFPDSPTLLGRYEGKIEIRTSLTGKKSPGSCQQSLSAGKAD